MTGARPALSRRLRMMGPRSRSAPPAFWRPRRLPRAARTASPHCREGDRRRRQYLDLADRRSQGWRRPRRGPQLPPGSPFEEFFDDFFKNRRGPGGGSKAAARDGSRARPNSLASAARPLRFLEEVVEELLGTASPAAIAGRAAVAATLGFDGLRGRDIDDGRRSPSRQCRPMPSRPRAEAGADAKNAGGASEDRGPHHARGDGSRRVWHGMSLLSRQVDWGPQCARTGLRRKHLSRHISAKNRPLRSSRSVDSQRDLRCLRRHSGMVRKHQTRNLEISSDVQ